MYIRMHFALFADNSVLHAGTVIILCTVGNTRKRDECHTVSTKSSFSGMGTMNQSLNDTTSSGKESKFGTHLSFIIASLTIALSLAALTCFIVVTACILYHLRKRKKQRLMCQNLEREYAVVNEPVYEDLLIVSAFHSGELQTCCNEAYQEIPGR